MQRVKHHRFQLSVKAHEYLVMSLGAKARIHFAVQEGPISDAPVSLCLQGTVSHHFVSA